MPGRPHQPELPDAAALDRVDLAPGLLGMSIQIIAPPISTAIKMAVMASLPLAVSCMGVPSGSSRPRTGTIHEYRRPLAFHERAYPRLGRLRRQQDVLRAEPADPDDRCAAHRHRAARRHP